jgi:hypothetical protein
LISGRPPSRAATPTETVNRVVPVRREATGYDAGPFDNDGVRVEPAGGPTYETDSLYGIAEVLGE